MRCVVIGSNGMLGSDFLIYSDPQLAIQGLTRLECDVTKLKQVEASVRDFDVVINCSAYTAVDAAESDPDQAFLINEVGVKNIAAACEKFNSKLVHISTDYVFAGDSKFPYKEDDLTNPVTVYGKSKLAGENMIRNILPSAHLIIRTAWLYGLNGNNFVKTMIDLEKKLPEIKVVNDQFGQPTWTKQLVELTNQLIISNIRPGTYHGTASGKTSWFEFARAIFREIGKDENRILPVSSEEFKRPAPRPKYSVLDHGALITQNIEPIELWDRGLHKFIQLMKSNA